MTIKHFSLKQMISSLICIKSKMLNPVTIQILSDYFAALRIIGVVVVVMRTVFLSQSKFENDLSLTALK